MNYSNINKKYAFSFLLVLLLENLAVAQLPNSDLGEKYGYRGVRSLGMGGVQTSTVNDETAVFVNPSNLLRLRNIYFLTADLEIDFSDTFYWPLYKNQSFSNPMDINSVFTSLNTSPGVGYYFRNLISSVFASQFFSIGFFSQQTLVGLINSSGNTAKAFYRDDQALYAGFALRLLDGHIKLGGSAKLISRIELDQQQPWPSLFSITHQGASGSGIGYDGSVSLILPYQFHPTFSIVVRDINQIRFDQKIFDRMKLNNFPQNQPQIIDFGFAIFPIHSSQNRSVWSFEINDVDKFQKRKNKIRNTHFGYEYNIKDVLFLRAGINQGFWTTGFEISSEKTQFQFAWYGEDIGPEDVSIPNRRFVFKWSFRF